MSINILRGSALEAAGENLEQKPLLFHFLNRKFVFKFNKFQGPYIIDHNTARRLVIRTALNK